VVTGAGHGIGAVIAGLAAKSGYRVAVWDIDGAAAARVAADIGDACLHVGPISHGSGYLFLPIWLAGGINILAQRFDAPAFAQILRDERVAYFFAVPTMVADVVSRAGGRPSASQRWYARSRIVFSLSFKRHSPSLSTSSAALPVGFTWRPLTDLPRIQENRECGVGRSSCSRCCP